MRILREYIANGSINLTFRLSHCFNTEMEILLVIERGFPFENFAAGLEIRRIVSASHFIAKSTHTPLQISEGFRIGFSLKKTTITATNTK